MSWTGSSKKMMSLSCLSWSLWFSEQMSWMSLPFCQLAGWPWPCSVALCGLNPWREGLRMEPSLQYSRPEAKSQSSWVRRPSVEAEGLRARRRWLICELTPLCPGTYAERSGKKLDLCCCWNQSLLEAWVDIARPYVPWAYKVPLGKSVWLSDAWRSRSWC